MKIFFDTNVLVYAFSTDARRARAVNAIAAGGTISVQVLNEFTNVLRRKQKQEWSVVAAALAVVRSHFTAIIPIDVDIHIAAVELARDHGLAFYDALIVAAAAASNCDRLLTEDMQHGRTFGFLEVQNPFI